MEKNKKIFRIILNIALYVVIILFCAGRMIDLREPLTKEQVRKAASEYFQETHTVKKISLYMGKPAGKLGYFFVELNPTGYIVIVNDARFPIDHAFSLKQTEYFKYFHDLESDRNFVEFMLDRPRGPSRILDPKFNSSVKLDFFSLIYRILGIKTRSEIFWGKYLDF